MAQHGRTIRRSIFGWTLPTSHECWAPEWFQDPQASGLSSVHVFLAITSDVCCSSGFAIYEKHPTAADFSTWSTAQAITIDGYSNLNPIDPFVVYEGGSYNLWIKNNGGFGVNHYLTYASSSNLLGGNTQSRIRVPIGPAGALETKGLV